MDYQTLLELSRKESHLDDKTIKYVLKYYLKVEPTLKMKIGQTKIDDYLRQLQKINEGYPIQYIVGNVDFYGYSFKVKPGVLIPRFETEQLVFRTKKYIDKYFSNKVSLLDIGTGTGVIGLTLKKEVPKIDVTMVDISAKALKLAKVNASHLNEDVTIYKSDMLDEVIRLNEKFDIIISNPPYLTKDEEIMEVVRRYEPSKALYGGKKGLKYYKVILANAKKVLKDRGLIAFEIGSSQTLDIIKIANKYFKDSPYEIKKDFQGRDRMFFLFYNLND